MSAALREPGAKSGAESAEVRKARRGAGSRAAGKCGRSAEEVRNLSLPCLAAFPAARPALPAVVPAPSLARPKAGIRRESSPPQTPNMRGDGWPAGCPASLARDLPAPEQAVIDAALAILARRVREPGAAIDAPGAARELARLHLAQCERERFAVMFLDAQHRLIAFEVLAEGTLTQTVRAGANLA